jgi:hypothetical protein
MSLSWLPLLMPFVYICARTRIETLSVGLYYLAATWPVIPGAHNFFGEHAPWPMAYDLWLLLALFGTLPWVAFFHRRVPELSVLAALVVLALPPLSLVTVGYPLTAAGIWFPGTAWVGLLAPCFLLAARKWFSMPWIIGLLAASSLIAHVFARVPQRDPHMVTINTPFGGLAFDMDSGTSPSNAQMEVLRGQLDAQQKFIESAALAHPGSVVFFPEGAIRAYSPFIDQQWKPFLDQLAAEHTTIVFGTTAPLPYTRAAYRNLLAQRGWTPDGRFAYVQRVPVPISMWKIGDRESGFPVLLQNPGAFKIRNAYAGVLMCYEQLLAWPALQTLADQPDFLVAPRNVYWAKGTPIPPIQHQAAQNWADLWGIPLYEAQNE